MLSDSRAGLDQRPSAYRLYVCEDRRNSFGGENFVGGQSLGEPLDCSLAVEQMVRHSQEDGLAKQGGHQDVSGFVVAADSIEQREAIGPEILNSAPPKYKSTGENLFFPPVALSFFCRLCSDSFIISGFLSDPWFQCNCS